MLVHIEPVLPRAVADFHAGFNIVIALAFLPLLSPLARLLERILPSPVQGADPSQPLYLDEAAIEFPSIALGHAAREALRMVDVLDSMIEGAAIAFQRPDRQEIARSRRLDDVLDALNGEIKHYVMRLDPEGLSDEERRRLEGILAFSLNLESGGDVIERNILPFAAKQMRRGVRTLVRGGTRDRIDLSGRTEQSCRSRFNLHDGRSSRGSGADRAKERVSSPGGRRDSRSSRPVAKERREAGAAPRPVARHQAAERPSGRGRRLPGAGGERRPAGEPDSDGSP